MAGAVRPLRVTAPTSWGIGSARHLFCAAQMGFSPGQVLGVLIGESAVIAVAGGLLGALGARYLLGGVDFAAFTTGFIQVFDVKWSTVALSAGISLVGSFSGL